jgi:uncharacterized membrane protein YkvA (DUF1232 family)
MPFKVHGMKALREIAHNIKVQAHAIWLCARDAELGWGPRLLALAIAAYALSPIDLIPDFIPVLGLLDDAILIPLGIWLFLKLVPQAIYARNLQGANEAGRRPVSRTGAVFIVTLWLLSAALLVGWLL